MVLLSEMEILKRTMELTCGSITCSTYFRGHLHSAPFLSLLFGFGFLKQKRIDLHINKVQQVVKEGIRL